VKITFYFTPKLKINVSGVKNGAYFLFSALFHRFFKNRPLA